jgi:hypothetical protein
VKDQYVGDVNDYLKYALLRALTGPTDRLGVAWMLTPSDERTDGERLGYLSQPHRYRQLDPVLFDALNALVVAGARAVDAIEHAELLTDCLYVRGVLPDDLLLRTRYFDRVWASTTDLTLLFFDPDNGLAVPSVRKGARNSSKDLYWDELQQAYKRGVSLIVYQHFPRRPRQTFLSELAERIHEATDSARVLSFSTAHVTFVVVPQPNHASRLEERLNDFSQHASPFVTTTTSLREM